MCSLSYDQTSSASAKDVVELRVKQIQLVSRFLSSPSLGLATQIHVPAGNAPVCFWKAAYPNLMYELSPERFGLPIAAHMCSTNSRRTFSKLRMLAVE